ncbi:DNA polymerase kappa [Chelonia mydas]|uniref:DNA polymerase kappa n=1 Tax=Chelonia mydas TaxID=8469 RepID=M7BH67_CHEMY|nr:DNA polymerase kappa [Chelonia mydas]
MDSTKKVINTSDDGGFLLRVGLNDNKAGMQGLDKEKINKIIMEATKGSRFYENELKKDQQVNQRIEKMMQLKDKITSQQLLKAQLQGLGYERPYTVEGNKGSEKTMDIRNGAVYENVSVVQKKHFCIGIQIL